MDAHGRDHITKAEMCFDQEGKIVGLGVKTLANLGAYLSTISTCVPTYLYGTLLQGLYTTPKITVDVVGVLTTTTRMLIGAQVALRPLILLERLMDLAALEMGKDPAAFTILPNLHIRLVAI